MITPIFSVDAYVNGCATHVFNIRDAEPVLWVKLPEPIVHLDIYSIIDVVGNAVPWERAEHESWFKIDTSNLDLSVGMHQYQIRMVDTVSDWVTYLYFSYIIQNDNPEKPYYYMGTEREEESDAD